MSAFDPMGLRNAANDGHRAEAARGLVNCATPTREQAFAIVERELRELELTVCQEGHRGPSPVWDGELQDGWSLLQAVAKLRAKR